LLLFSALKNDCHDITELLLKRALNIQTFKHWLKLNVVLWNFVKKLMFLRRNKGLQMGAA
jgi:hypothetical protein